MKKKIIIIILLGILSLYMIMVAIGFYSTETDKKPVVKEKLESKDYDYLFDFYFTSDPKIENRAYIGSSDAPITIIAYIDLQSDVSQEFISDIFPDLKKDYIDTGIARYYHKNFITIEDYQQKNERFIYAKYLICFIDQEKDYYRFYLDLFNVSNPDEILDLAENYNISDVGIKECVKKEEFIEIIEDISEVENAGMSLNPRFYIGLFGKDNIIIEGIPSYRKFIRSIKDNQILLGD